MRRLVRNICGFALLVVGAVMIVLPGPGWVTIAIGLALLAPDFPWAHGLLQRIKRAGGRMRDLFARKP